MAAQSQSVIVTGASANHSRSLSQFLDSVTVHEPQTRCVVYDLGLTDEQRDVLLRKTATGPFEYRRFDFAKYPAHFDIRVNTGEYAWKPAIIREIAAEHCGQIIWCDAGNILLGPLTMAREAIRRFKIYSPASSGDIERWTHPGCLRAFGIGAGRPILKMQNRNGAFLGFDAADAEVRKFIGVYFQCAELKQYIAPPGSSRENHRQDQAVFSILYYFYKEAQGLAHVNDYLGFSIHNDIDQAA